MSKPLTVVIPHQLGRAEARRRLEDGFSRFAHQFGEGAQVHKIWEGDRLAFSAQVMGQSISGALDVRDDAVNMEVNLPGLLGLIAGKIKGRLEQEGQLLLSKK